MKLSELIIAYRFDHNLSQRQMAAQCNLSTGYISLIEKETNPQTGKRMVPSLVVLDKLAKGMGITLDALIASCEDMPVSISPPAADTSGLTPKQREALSLIESMSEEQLDSFLKLFNR